MKTNEDIQTLNKQALLYSKDLDAIIEEMHRVIIGQDNVLEKLILALVADGHVLLEGMPGLAKTLMVNYHPTSRVASCFIASPLRLLRQA